MVQNLNTKFLCPFIFPSHVSSTSPSHILIPTFAFSVPSLTYLNTAQGITQQGTMAVPQHCTISSLKTILDSLKFLIVSFSQLWVRTISTTLHKDYSSDLQCSISLYPLQMTSPPALERKQMKVVQMETL